MHPDLTPKDVERFWSRVDRSAGPDACWPWLGKCSPYGAFHWGGEPGHSRRHHRIAYFLAYGEWPDQTHHRCENKRCANPAHLESVSRTVHRERHYTPATHCSKGHALTPDNIYIVHDLRKKNPMRRCRKCDLVAHVRAYAAKPKIAKPKRCGELSPHAKLTEDQVRDIRQRYVRGTVRQEDLARQFGVSQSVISTIIRRSQWKHVD